MEIPLTLQPAGWELACASTSVGDFEKAIQWESGYPVPGEAEHFSPDTLRFGESYSGGLRLARWKEFATNRIIYALRKENAVAFLDSPEWGRHVELSASGASSLRYEAGRKLFAIRATARPPRLLGRALCLCSGKLPTLTDAVTGKSKTLWLAFESVSQPVANMVAENWVKNLVRSPFSPQERKHMNDPIGAYNKVRENFIRYVKTAFGTRFATLEAEREALLRSTASEGGSRFTTEPFIEPRPSYKTDRPPSQLASSDLPGFSEADVRDVSDFLRSGLFRESG